MTDFPASLTSPRQGCQGCTGSPPLDFSFEYAYQPIVDLRDHSIFAHEALVRGPNGEGAYTVLSQVNDQNRYRFDQSCRMAAIAGAAQLGMTERLSINFLPNAVYRPELCIRSTLEAARQYDFPIERLIFETVEGEYLADIDHLLNVLRQYREFGFMTAIDDFGAGYSGLTLLANFQPDLIKLDINLIRDIHLHRARQAIVRAVVQMCADLGVMVIAEGIEHREERDFLADCGIFLMQGYWFARPAFKALATVEPQAWQTS